MDGGSSFPKYKSTTLPAGSAANILTIRTSSISTTTERSHGKRWAASAKAIVALLSPPLSGNLAVFHPPGGVSPGKSSTRANASFVCGTMKGMTS